MDDLLFGLVVLCALLTTLLLSALLTNKHEQRLPTVVVYQPMYLAWSRVENRQVCGDWQYIFGGDDPEQVLQAARCWLPKSGYGLLVLPNGDKPTEDA